MSQRPIVDWNKPDQIPPVEKFAMDVYWIAVETHWRGKPEVCVFLAHYINKPLEMDENDEPTDPNAHINEDGEYVEAIGWHSEQEHPDFNGYYSPISFNDKYKLLGWAEYLPPEFK